MACLANTHVTTETEDLVYISSSFVESCLSVISQVRYHVIKWFLEIFNNHCNLSSKVKVVHQLQPQN
jgi:hypothetical protein